MATTYTVTDSFSADTTAEASKVNQNFTDVLDALNSFDATNLTGTISLARISNLTVTQMADAFFKDEDNMASNSATAVASQQSVKAYADGRAAAAMTPTSYAGEESVTFPNGLILKLGETAISGANNINHTITFGVPFTTICIEAIACSGTSVSGLDWAIKTHTMAKASFKCRVNVASYNTPIRWFAVGY